MIDCARVGHPAGILLLVLFLLRVVGGSGLVLCVCSDGHADFEFIGDTCCAEVSQPAPQPQGSSEDQVSGPQCECQDTLVAPGLAVVPPSQDDSALAFLALEPPALLDVELPCPTFVAVPFAPPAHELGHPPSTVVLRL